ncbi:MAG TPA: tetratricopeptide repeat protein, partial [Thermoanaerobaculia bacterium]|nr:tetratricopeptide repeat protein [Thermoanaerobaculia bacterium]
MVVCSVSRLALGADPYTRAEALAAERQFDQAEIEYRSQLETRPQDWRLRLGLARVILWDGRYAEAEDHFSALLADRPADVNALLGYAQAAYWWGDFRAART